MKDDGGEVSTVRFPHRSLDIPLAMKLLAHLTLLLIYWTRQP